MLISAIEAQLNIINYELKFTLDNGHFITEVALNVVLAKALNWLYIIIRYNYKGSDSESYLFVFEKIEVTYNNSEYSL